MEWRSPRRLHPNSLARASRLRRVRQRMGRCVRVLRRYDLKMGGRHRENRVDIRPTPSSGSHQAQPRFIARHVSRVNRCTCPDESLSRVVEGLCRTSNAISSLNIMACDFRLLRNQPRNRALNRIIMCFANDIRFEDRSPHPHFVSKQHITSRHVVYDTESKLGIKLDLARTKYQTVG